MSKPRNLFGLLLAIALLASLGLSTRISAQPATPEPSGQIGMARLDGSLAFFDFTVEPGGTATDSVNILVYGAPTRVLSFTTNLIPGENGGYTPAMEPEELVGAAAWVDFPTQEYELAADTGLTREVTVRVPDDAQPGEYTAAIVLQGIEDADEPATPEATPTAEATPQITVKYTVRYVLFVSITVPGPLEPSMVVGPASVMTTASGTHVVVDLANTGNARLRPDASLRVLDEEGAPVIEQAFRLGSILSYSETVLKATFPATPALGTYTIELELVHEAKGYDSGPLTFEVIVDEAALTFRDTTLSRPAITSVAVNPVESSGRVAYADIAVEIDNPGQEVRRSVVTLTVYRNGEKLEDYPLSSGVPLGEGASTVTGRYIPPTGWETGAYTFTVTLSSIDPVSNQQVELAVFESTDTVVIR
jgi:hypothetical protein